MHQNEQMFKSDLITTIYDYANTFDEAAYIAIAEKLKDSLLMKLNTKRLFSSVFDKSRAIYKCMFEYCYE